MLYESTDYPLRIPQLKLPLSAPTTSEPLEIRRLKLKRGQRVWITEGGITLAGSVVDLTPAKLGPPVVPSVNIEARSVRRT